MYYLADNEDKSPARLLERSELEKLIQDGLTKMPGTERIVLDLYYRQGCNIREIAPVLNLHITRISQLKAQGILRLTAIHRTAMADSQGIVLMDEPGWNRSISEARSASQAAQPLKPEQRGRNPMDVLMQVEVPVSVSLGRTKMRMKDLLGLAHGSVVELDEYVGDEVEILVNKRVLAHGEVVAVDGNYGVRITRMGGAAAENRASTESQRARGGRCWRVVSAIGCLP